MYLLIECINENFKENYESYYKNIYQHHKGDSGIDLIYFGNENDSYIQSNSTKLISLGIKCAAYKYKIGNINNHSIKTIWNSQTNKNIEKWINIAN